MLCGSPRLMTASSKLCSPPPPEKGKGKEKKRKDEKRGKVARKRERDRRKRKEKEKEQPMKHVHSKEFSALTMMPSLTCLHFVLSKKQKTAGIHLSSANKTPIDVFPGPLTLPSFRLCVPNPNAFLPYMSLS